MRLIVAAGKEPAARPPALPGYAPSAKYYDTCCRWLLRDAVAENEQPVSVGKLDATMRMRLMIRLYRAGEDLGSKFSSSHTSEALPITPTIRTLRPSGLT